MTGLGQRFETIITVCSSVLPFICGIHNNAIILLTAYVGKSNIMSSVFQLGKLRENMMMQRIVSRARTWMQLFWLIFCSSVSQATQTGEATLATHCWEGVSVYRTFDFSVFTLHPERGMQRLWTENPWASTSTSPKKHSTMITDQRTGRNWAV